MSQALSQVADGIGLQGEFTFRVFKSDGSVRQQWQENAFGRYLRKRHGLALRLPLITGLYADEVVARNLLTNAGFAGSASRLNGAGGEAAFTYLAVGTGTTAPDVADTTLEAEIVDSGLERATATVTRVTTTVTDDTAQLDKTFSVTGTKAVTEAGALNAASTGVLLCRQTFSAINVVDGDSLQIIYKIKVSA